MFCMVAALYPAEWNTEWKLSCPYMTILNIKDIEFPMTLSQIKKFENFKDISINVYCIEKKKELSNLSIRFTDRKMDKHVNLLYILDDNTEHFVWIKNLSQLVSSQLSRQKNRKFFCDRYVHINWKIKKYFYVFNKLCFCRCLHYFGSNKKLKAHAVDCG